MSGTWDGKLLFPRGVREAGFEERLHPRGRGGKWVEVLGHLTSMKPGYSRRFGPTLGHPLVTRGEKGREHEYVVQRGPDVVHRGTAENVADFLQPRKRREQVAAIKKQQASPATKYKVAAQRKARERGTPPEGGYVRDPGEDMADLFNRGMASPGEREEDRLDPASRAIRRGAAERTPPDWDRTRARLLTTIRKHDEAEAKKPGFNRYALPQYLGALQWVDSLVQGGVPVDEALDRAFTGRLGAKLKRTAAHDPNFKGGSKMSRRSGFDLLTETRR